MGEPSPADIDWRSDLPVLIGRRVTLREPSSEDLAAVAEVLALPDATHFGHDRPPTLLDAQRLIDSASRERSAGRAFTYVITLTVSRAVVGLLQVRQLDPAFESGEWEFTLLPSVRGTGVFLDAARLAGSLAFGTVGMHRLEARTLLRNGRANGALRKLGAVQEGVLRRSIRQAGGGYVDQVLWAILKEDWGDHWVSTSPRVH
jgi:RimJ/RimL family protein N-acetyltransferase